MLKSPLAIALMGCLFSCSEAAVTSGGRDDAASARNDTNGSGGVETTGGTMSSGGTSAAGGVGSGGSAGSAGSGGVSGTGGRPGTGGTTASGGNTGSGGSTASGGVPGSGGRIGTGGITTSGGSTGSGGRPGTGGATGSGGRPGTDGATGSGGSNGSGTSTSTSAPGCNTTLPAAASKITTSSTISVSGTKDYNMQQVCADPSSLGAGDQSENQKPVFMLAANAVLKNVIIGGSGCSAADGVHCENGSCTLENVWFGDVGEDAVTFKGSSTSQVMTITGGGAFSASDKVIQHNGPGTIKISNFYVNTVGKLYRSCGNCGTQYERHIVLDHITAKSAKYLVGINANYNDTATLTNITICGGGTTICEKYTGNNSGAEPPAIGSGPDGKNCIYTTADITNL